MHGDLPAKERRGVWDRAGTSGRDEVLAHGAGRSSSQFSHEKAGREQVWCLSLGIERIPKGVPNVHAKIVAAHSNGADGANQSFEHFR